MSVHWGGVVVRSGLVRGRVTGAGGEGLPGARVRAVPHGATPGATPTEALADATGHYELRDLEPGAHRLEVSSVGRPRLTARTFDVYVEDGEPVVYDVVVSDDPALAVRVVDERGTPLAGGCAFVIDGSGAVSSAALDDQGLVEIEGLAPGRHTLLVRREGLVGSLEVEVGGPHPGLHQVVARPAPRVAGRLVGPAGSGAAGLEVRVTALHGSVVREIVSGADGAFELSDLYPADYRLEVAGAEPLAFTVSDHDVELRVPLAETPDVACR